MPTYDYKCLSCNNTFEIFQSMKDEHIKICPKCEGQVKRLIGSGAGTIFKGSGFYQTDYKNASNKTEKKVAEKAKESKSSSESNSKSKGVTDNI